MYGFGLDVGLIDAGSGGKRRKGGINRSKRAR
jgi:hypothetical protein